jgi:hypothetical protein
LTGLALEMSVILLKDLTRCLINGHINLAKIESEAVHFNHLSTSSVALAGADVVNFGDSLSLVACDILVVTSSCEIID